MDTIFALATARGKAGVSVVRLSGPGAWACVAGMVHDLPEPRRASVRALEIDGEVVDRALVLLFEERRSFTGEEVAELHLHGSPAIVARVLRHLAEYPGMRLAEPGEFSRRALENGRLDLSQIEGLGDLIDAETEAQRRQAMRVFSGALGERVAGWRAALVTVAALLASGIDFADEDIPEDQTGEMLRLLDEVGRSFSREISGFHFSERVRDGFEVAILGAPNAGKSTLLNAIVGRPAALTSEKAGTTRDVIEVRLDLGGLAVTLLDTAGLRESADEIESAGIALAVDRAARADLRIFLTEDGALPGEVAVQEGDLVVWSKADLGQGSGLRVSGLTGEGIEQLLEMVRENLAGRMAGAALITRERHRVALERARVAVARAQDEIGTGGGRFELAAEHVRSAITALDVLIGKVDVEDLLDEIFARFCIGK